MHVRVNDKYSTGPIAKLIDPFRPMDDSDVKKVDLMTMKARLTSCLTIWPAMPNLSASEIG